MKRLLLLFFISISLVGITQVKDQKARELLDQVSAKAKAAKSIKTDFTYTMVNQKAKINEEKSGMALISGDKYRMTAAGQIIICDGKTIWTYIKSSNEAQVNDAAGNEDAITPTKLLTSYNKNYLAKMAKSSDPALEMVELTPTKANNVTKVILGIDKSKKQIANFKIFDKGGNIFTYTLKSYSTDVPVTPADFTFDPKKYPGVEVIDMR
jgi:chaperone LolA